MQQTVLASSNQGKLNELQPLLASLDWQLRPKNEFNLPDPEETGLSFIENALIKARHAASHTGLPALADDSGLVVPVLNGAPGIYSARYAGINASDNDNVDKLLSELKERSVRSAFFFCCLAFVRHAADPTPIIAEGRWHGEIATAPMGSGGFGYDPVFFIPNLQQTAAQLAPLDKNHISHRAKAIQALQHRLAVDDV